MAYPGPDQPERPLDSDEVRVWRERGSALPQPGDHVLYRHHEFGDITDALVLDVPAPDENDPMEQVGDQPWRVLLLQTGHGRVLTREARVRGSAGWLPLTWLLEA